jgi:hypothetical protein
VYDQIANRLNYSSVLGFHGLRGLAGGLQADGYSGDVSSQSGFGLAVKEDHKRSPMAPTQLGEKDQDREFGLKC